MCTLTFIPTSNSSFVLTSNRDESPLRDTIPPRKYMVNNVPLWFPKDTKAGGTWLGVSGIERCVCLLNGGFDAHKTGGAYRMSRGLVVKDLLVVDDVVKKIERYNFNGVEPFTMIIVEWTNSLKLYELVWDGVHPFFTEKPLEATIWSSSLLYSKPTKIKRERWFESFMVGHSTKISEDILTFHKTAGDGDIKNDLIMNRTFVKTKSITQVTKKDTVVTMQYEDLEKQTIINNTIEI